MFPYYNIAVLTMCGFFENPQIKFLQQYLKWFFVTLSAICKNQNFYFFLNSSLIICKEKNSQNEKFLFEIIFVHFYWHLYRERKYFLFIKLRHLFVLHPEDIACWKFAPTDFPKRSFRQQTLFLFFKYSSHTYKKFWLILSLYSC